jgi:flagellar hook-length control protein FliK
VNSGSGASTGGLTGAPRVVEREETARTRDGEQAAALWVALAQSVTGAQSLALPAAPSVSPPPSAWHSSAGDMTPARGAEPAAAGAPLEPKPAERMTLRVDGGALGELEVTLDRQEGGMRVVIGMENQHLVGSVLPDTAALRTALENAGITVQSLNVVTQSEVGTVLAQRRVSPSGQKADAQPSADQKPEDPKKRTHKRLTLIG